ncbi:MAG TPA: biotin/lipoyl-containing protein [Planctomycetota bacterium]|nr:biotin/lipoyl-containing protein [Planctomycetota bacterium]
MTAHPFHARVRAGGAHHRIDVRLEGDRLVGTVDGVAVDATVRAAGLDQVVVQTGGRRHVAVVVRAGGAWLVSTGGRTVEVARAEGAADDAAATPAGDPFATSPMTGVVAKVHATAGAALSKGAPLFAVEAMKMEYVVRADRDVVVDEVRAKQGDRVNVGAVVVTFKDPGEGAPG